MPCVLLYWLCKVYAVCAGVSTVLLAPGTTWRVCVPDAEGPARLPLFREVHRPVGPAAAASRGAQRPIGTLQLLCDHMFWNHLDKFLLIYCLRFDRCSDPLFLCMQMYSLLPVSKLSGYNYNIEDPESNPCTPVGPLIPFPVPVDRRLGHFWIFNDRIDVYRVFRVSVIKGWYLCFQANI